MDGTRKKIGFIVENGNVQPVNLKYRKCPETKPATRKKKTVSVLLPQESFGPRMPLCPEASPPMSPQEQRRGGRQVVQRRRIPSRGLHFSEIVSSVIGESVASRDKLFRMIITRVPKLITTKGDTDWALQELNDVNAHCVRLASSVTTVREDNYRFIIRAPVPWHQQFLIAREFASHNLFAIHPVARAITRLWESRYRASSLLKDCLNAKDTPEPAQLLRLIQQQCKTLKDSLTEKFIPDCHALLMELKPTWAAMVPLKSGESLKQIKRFFNCLARLISMHVRRLLHEWLDEWLSVIQIYRGHNKIGRTYTDMTYQMKPLMKIDLRVTNGKIHVYPDAAQIHQTAEKVLRTIVETSSQIPRVEKILLPGYNSGQDYLAQLSWREDHVQGILKRTREVVNSNQQGSEVYIRLVYDGYVRMLQSSFHDSFDVEPATDAPWDDVEQLFKQRIIKLNSMMEELKQLRTHAYLKLFFLDCSTLNEQLIGLISRLKTLLITRLLSDNRRIVRNVCTRFENVTERVSRLPDTTAELVESIEYVRLSQTESLLQMRHEVNLARKRLLMLLDYTILPKDDVTLSCRLFHWPQDLDSVLQVSATRLQRIRVETERALKERTDSFLNRLVDYGLALDLFKNKETNSLTTEDMKNSTALLHDLHLKLQAASVELGEINHDEALLEWPTTEAPSLPSLIKQIDPYYQLWHVAFKFHQSYNVWFHGPFRNLDSQTIATEIKEMHQQMIQLGIIFEEVSGARRVAETIRKRIEKFIGFLPLLHAVCNPGLRERHWLQISQNFESSMCPEPETSLSELVSAGLMQFITHIEEVSTTATKEFALEEILRRMQAEWDNIRFEFLPYRDSDVCVLTGIEEIQALVDDHILRAQTMHASAYIAPLEPVLQAWEEQLVGVQDTMDVWLKVQSTWLYLEPIFSSEDIQRQMASDAAKFSQVDKMWRSLMSSVTSEPRVLVAASREGLLDELRGAFAILEDIQKGLHDYLEKKRLFFSRFYFLSNDELLEILSKTKEPERIQPHLRKCFDGISRLQFNSNQEIQAMVSNENEVVRFRENIVPAKSKGMVELWMSEVDDAMKDSLIHLTNMAMDEWSYKPDIAYLQKFPGQSIMCAAAINWTSTMTHAIQTSCRFRELEELTSSTISHMVSMVKNSPNHIVRITLNNLIIYFTHARDVVHRLKVKHVSSTTDFHWQANLRFYWNTDPLEGLGHLTVALLETQVPYGFEYMGNTQRLVVTPTTEKGYQIIMLALKQFQGGWLHGLQGVGKTETVKELAQTIAKQCLVFNCFHGLDTRSIGRILKGVAQSGAWSCFDDVDQIAPDVISVMAVQVQILQTALVRRLRRVHFEGVDVQMTAGCAVFITTKTRELLPDSFRALFRLASVSPPDLQFVITISLQAQGFQNHQILGLNIFHLVRAISQEIPDVATTVSLRTIREILKTAGRLRNEHRSWDENAVIHQSFISFFRTQLAPQQGDILERLVGEMFPVNVEKPVGSGAIHQVVSEACQELSLVPSAAFVEKVCQLYETLSTRHGVILLGEALAGKSTLYKVLARIYPKITGTTQSEDAGRVVFQVISPWSLPSKYLYEWSEPEKNKWNDGVITKALRELSSNSPTSPRWLILDGHVHSELVGHLHTLLDASRKLTLPSGEILQIPQSLRIIFETSDLTYAAPSTISRCGIVRVSDDIVPLDSLNTSWLKRSSFMPDVLSTVGNFVEHVLKPVVHFFRQSPEKCLYSMQPSYLFISFTRLFGCLVVKDPPMKPLALMRTMTFCCVWTIGTTLKCEFKEEFNFFLRGIFESPSNAEKLGKDLVGKVLPPAGTCIFSYKIDATNGAWIRWKEALPNVSSSEDSLVLNNESMGILNFFVKTYANGGVPVLILGKAGVGKSTITQYAIEDMPKDRFVHNVVHVTPVTTASSLQSSIMTGLDRRRKGVYGPALGRRCILFVDDLAACEPVEGNIRTPLELFRHWLNFECIFDGRTASKMELVDMQLVVATRLGDTFHEDVDLRLLRHMNIVYIDQFSRDDLQEMVTSALQKHFSKGYSNAVSKLAKTLSVATIELYEVWKQEKSDTGIAHYSVGMSCINRIVQGLKQVSPASLTNANKLHRLWIHEICRVWADRLTSEEDRAWFLQSLDKISVTHFKLNLDQCSFTSSYGNMDYKILPKIYFSKLQSAESVVDEIPDMDAMVTLMENKLSQFNKTIKSGPIELVISLHVANHILYSTQALSRPRGHVILIGDAGSGRRSCAMVSALLLDYEIFQIKAGRKYGMAEWKEDMKHLIRRTGIEMEKTVFLCNMAVLQKHIFFDYIARLICGYEIPELFSSEERVEMVELYQKQTKDNAGKFAQIFAHVEENLRVCVCVSPADSIYQRFHLYPTMFKYASVIWFEPWPEETLEVIGKKCLEGIPGLNDKLQSNYLGYFKSVHNSMCSDERIIHSSSTYLELLATFRQLWTKKQQGLLQQKDRYNVGLNKLQFAASQVVIMQDELRRLQPQLVETSAETESLMVKIEQDTVEVEAQKEIIAADEALANEAAAAAQAIKDECESDLSEATPALEAAINALDTLKPADITLVKSMRHPPPIVKLVMEAVCVMKQIQPAKKLDMTTGRIDDDFWPASLKLLGDLRFLDLLRAYDKDNIPVHVMKRIREKYIPNPEFNPNIVRHVSAACEGLCRWVRAMEVYDRVIKIVSPKRAKLQEAEQELTRQMKRLSEKHTQLQQISDKLQGLNDDFAAMSKKKKDLEDSIDQCHQKMERAAKLIGGLGGEQENWRTSSNNLDFKLQQLPGDVLLSASIITYLGAATNDYRTECVQKWLELIRTWEIPSSPSFSLVDCMIDAVKSRAWNLAGLPNDKYSLDNGIIATHTQRWPLLIDPQEQGLKWIVEIESKNQVELIRYDEPTYLSTLAQCVTQGRTVVMVNVKDTLDPELDYLLAKRTFVLDDKTWIQMGSQKVEWSKNFRLYLLTDEEGSAANLELAAKLTIVNFKLTRAGLEDKFLSLFLSSERPELEEQKQMLMVQSATNQRQIRDLEDRILYVLSSSRGNILEDETATRTLYNSKITSEGISRKQLEIQKSESEIDQVRESYRPVASHAASLYSCIGRLRYLNNIYQFALPWFTNLFIHSVTTSNTSSIAGERIVYVNEHFTKTLYYSIRRALFFRDRHVFTLLLAFGALRSKSDVEEEIVDRLYAEARLPSTTWIGPSWIDPDRWQHVMDLSKAIPQLKDLPHHIETNWQAWKRFYEHPDCYILPAPCDSLEPLEQLLIIKHLKPNAFMTATSAFVKSVLGPYCVDNTSGDLVGVYDESKSTVPVLCFVAGNSDPIQSIGQLCEIKLENRSKMKFFALGRGSDRRVFQFISRCSDEGQWAVVQNIHLFPGLVDEILDYFKQDPNKVAAEFRLWMIGYPSSQYSSRALQHCIKTVIEPPACFRDALIEILKLDFVHSFSASRAAAAETSFQATNPSQVEKENTLFKSEPWRRISFALFCYHALLLERCSYGSLGFSGRVEFTYHDLKSALTLVKDAMMSAKELSIASIRSMVVDSVYRAQLSNENDGIILRQLIQCLIKTNIYHSEVLMVTMCGKVVIPFTTNRRQLMEVLRYLPTDLGPEAVGLSSELVKEKQGDESVDLLRKLNCCSSSTRL